MATFFLGGGGWGRGSWFFPDMFLGGLPKISINMTEGKRAGTRGKENELLEYKMIGCRERRKEMVYSHFSQYPLLFLLSFEKEH